MGRVYFPTKNDIGKRTLSGVTLGSDYAGFRSPAEPAPRAVSTLATLGAMVITNHVNDGMWGGNPPRYTGPIGWLGSPVRIDPIVPITRPISVAAPTPAPTPVTAVPAPAPPVSQQTTPTPVVTVPPAQSTGAVLVTSGGGTASPNVAPAAAAPAAVTYTNDASGNIINAQTGAIVVPAAQAASSGASAASMNAAAAAASADGSSAAAPSASATVAAPTDVTSQIAAWLGGSTSIGSYAVPNALLAAAVVLGFAWLSSGSTGKKR